jgi:hypothetical protein
VRSVELVSGTIPANPYNLIAGANQFTLTETAAGSTVSQTISLTPGYYTQATFLTHLNTVFTGLTTMNSYTWSYSSTSEKLSLTRSAGVATFGLLFLSGVPSDNIDRSDGFFLQQTTPALQLGFDLSDYYDVSGVIEAPFPMDLASAMNRLYLYINLQSSQDLSAIERGAGRRWPFAIIYLDAATNGYKYLNKETFNSITYSLPQPISRLQNLEIEFRDEWYRLVNFNGKDFTLLLEFTTLE